MVSFEEAGRMLDRAVDELPEEIYKDLNGGVNLIPDERMSGDGRYTMGLYHNDAMGRYIEIFYGSFAALYGELSPARFEKQLKKTLHHELTHHLENKAGDRSLERWDEEQTLLWQQQCAMTKVDSLLFYGDDALLPYAAERLFRRLADERCPEIVSACCFSGRDGISEPELSQARAALGIPAPEHEPEKPSQTFLARYDAVLCMTLEQADELAELYPDFDERIMCLGQTDIKRPRLRSGWAKVLRKLQNETQSLIDELCAEDK